MAVWKIALASLAISLSSIAAHAGWSPDEMDAQIEKTNVEVGGVCSGTIISKSERLVLTAHHCITDLLQEVVEKTVNSDGSITEKKVQKRVPLTVRIHKIANFDIVSTQEYLAKIVGDDPANDISIIQIVDVNFVPEMEVKLAGDYPLKRGMRVYAVGNPAIVYGNSITDGIISAPERAVSISGIEYKFFQHSANVIGGNSGGSILNEDGEIIGTLSAGVRGADISFAVPIRFTKDLLRKIGFEKVLEVK